MDHPRVLLVEKLLQRMDEDKPTCEILKAAPGFGRQGIAKPFEVFH